MIFSDWPWRHWCALKAEQPALRLNGACLTWRELCQRTDALASGFVQQGVREGDGVMLQAHNHPDTLLAWLALLQCGARILPVNPQLPRSVLKIMLPPLTLRFALVLNGDGGYSGLSALSLEPLQGSAGAEWQPYRLATMTLTSARRGCRKRPCTPVPPTLQAPKACWPFCPMPEKTTGCSRCRCFMSPGKGSCGAGCWQVPA